MTREHPPLERSSARPASNQPVAVALKESGTPNKAPSVVATGRGEVADAILDIAFALGIKVRADADLAEMLSVVDLGEEVPTEAFHAIAEILTYLYRAQGRLDPAENRSWA